MTATSWFSALTTAWPAFSVETTALQLAAWTLGAAFALLALATVGLWCWWSLTRR